MDVISGIQKLDVDVTLQVFAAEYKLSKSRVACFWCWCVCMVAVLTCHLFSAIVFNILHILLYFFPFSHSLIIIIWENIFIMVQWLALCIHTRSLRQKAERFDNKWSHSKMKADATYNQSRPFTVWRAPITPPLEIE